MLVRSISGLRATLGDDLTPALIARYAGAFAHYTSGGPIAVGRDGRLGGEAIERIVIGTLTACGVTVHRLGVVPTPTVQLATGTSEATGGISITASHNPEEWNGLKFLGPDGLFLGPAEVAKFFEIVDNGIINLVGFRDQGSVVERTEIIDEHTGRVLALPFIDRDAIRERALHVVVDAVNASGSVIVPRLLEELGVRVTPLHCDSSGLFPHTPEPLPQNLTGLSEAVRTHGADLGIAVDPDADRLVLIDEHGEAIGEEYTITLAADYILPRAEILDAKRSVAVNLSTTRAVDDVAARHGAEVVRTAVGEINVVEGLQRSGGVIGGEGSGGVILPALHFGRDSLAGIVLTLSALAASRMSLSELRASLPDYVIVKVKIALEDRAQIGAVLDTIRTHYSGSARINETDGLRLDFERSWAHIRPSNTEPILRIITEAPELREAESLAEEIGALIR